MAVLLRPYVLGHIAGSVVVNDEFVWSQLDQRCLPQGNDDGGKVLGYQGKQISIADIAS